MRHFLVLSKQLILKHISYVLEILFQKLHFENFIQEVLFQKFHFENIVLKTPKCLF